MASEHIQVAVRLRPLNRAEQEAGERRIWTITRNTVMIRPESCHFLAAERRIAPSAHPSFQFDCCFSWEDDTQRVYDTLLKRMVGSTLEGYNATVFAYGQTGSGKTFTMLGTAEELEIPGNPHKMRKESADLGENRRFRGKISSRKRSLTPKNSELGVKKAFSGVNSKGIMTLAFEDLFFTIQTTPQTHYFLTCSYMEIYNEHIFDLLRENPDSKEPLSVSETSEREFYVKGLTAHPVKSLEEVRSRLEYGETMRHYAVTQLNHHSSRSHTIFRLHIKSIQVLNADCEEEKSDITENLTTESVLNFVDLAGSERLGSEGSLNASFASKSEQDKTVAEGKHINTSLFYLCQVITKLAEMKQGIVKSDAHVPFRNSILTKILRGSLGGNARTCVLCTATPAFSQFDQTISTFRFGVSARTVTNRVQPNVRQVSSAQLLLAYERDVADLRKELEVTVSKGRNLAWESYGARMALEGRIKRLSGKLAEVGRDRENWVYAGWVGSAGELIVAKKWSKCQEKDPISLKCDENGDLAATRSSQIAAKMTVSAQAQKSLSATVTSSLQAKDSLSLQLNSLTNRLETDQNKVNSLQSQLYSVTKQLKFVQSRADLYTKSIGMERLSDEEITGLEAELLIAIDRVLDAKAQNRTNRLIKTLQNRLFSFISESENQSMDPKQLSFPDLSAIEELHNETTDSVNQMFST